MVRRQLKAAQAAHLNGYEREEKGDVVLPINKTPVINTPGERFDYHLDHYILRYHFFQLITSFASPLESIDDEAL
jgi:hypothetical protein